MRNVASGAAATREGQAITVPSPSKARLCVAPIATSTTPPLPAGTRGRCSVVCDVCGNEMVAQLRGENGEVVTVYACRVCLAVRMGEAA